jgi:hypothetical protein
MPAATMPWPCAAFYHPQPIRLADVLGLRETEGPGFRGLRLGVEDSNLGIRIQSPLSYH